MRISRETDCTDTSAGYGQRRRPPTMVGMSTVPCMNNVRQISESTDFVWLAHNFNRGRACHAGWVQADGVRVMREGMHRRWQPVGVGDGCRDCVGSAASHDHLCRQIT